MSRAVILYDGNCSLCKRTVKTLAFFDIFHQLEFVNFLSQEAEKVYKPLNLTLQDLLFDMHIVEGTRTWKGYEAYQRISLRLPLLWVLVPFLFFGPIKRIGINYYRKIADSRTCVIKPKGIEA